MRAFGLAESNDESMQALNHILAAWEEGTENGIAPELLAYAALYTALTDLVASFGEELGGQPRKWVGRARAQGRIYTVSLASISKPAPLQRVSRGSTSPPAGRS